MKSKLNIIRTAQNKSKTISVSLLLFLCLVFISCNQNKNNETHHHPIQDSTMDNMQGMDMSGMSKNVSDTSLRSLVLPVSFQVISAQKSVKPSLLTSASIKTHGYISLDERLSYKVSARISGRIEKLYIRYNLQHVNKGDKIMEVYSPELNTYQDEFLYLLKNKSDQNLIDRSEEKLRLLGITQDQINSLKKTGVPLSTITVYSPQDGFVFFNPLATPPKASMNQVQISNESEMQGSDSNPSMSFVSENSQLRTGSYLNKGDVLFWINDLQQVLAIVVVANGHEHELRIGTKVSMISELYKNDTVKTQISFIEPVYQPDQKFVRARIYLSNTSHKYKINSLLDAEINGEKQKTLSIPYSSVLFLGKRKIVWVLAGASSGNNRIYEVRDVVTGEVHGDRIEIKKGLTANDEVAIGAGYLLDRESLIKPE